MTISYKWLLEYLPLSLEPEQIATILNSIGMEVEKMEPFEEVKGGLAGLVLGEVLSVEKHPNADKLSLTKVNIGSAEPLAIVCGAPNVAAGQKVVVAPVGATIFPVSGDPLTMRVAKIRGAESHGMICAEDEIGLGSSHEGILVLDPSVVPGTPAATHFQPYSDIIFELGLTPNRSDAMSHLGVARDICAYLSHHHHTPYTVKKPFPETSFDVPAATMPVRIEVQDAVACPRYAGMSITGVKVGPSPAWLKQRLNAIGVRSINNIVDITNYMLHETGQPLHAFDASRISGQKVIVKKLPQGTAFRSLDDKERSLHSEDLMICDGNESPMCMAGVFGGKDTGVSENTTSIFLESAVFEAGMIRKTSFRHQLRTDAATRFEKNVDISNTVNVLKRAASLILEIAGGQPGSPVIDVYPQQVSPKRVSTSHAFLRRISGKDYPAETTFTILSALGFTIVEADDANFTVEVPLHKTDISLPADLAEEVMRIDGFDNIQIPTSIAISPSTEENQPAFARKEKISNILAGMGFQEMLNNSITRSTYLTNEEAATTVRMMNSLSAELDVLRPSMLETGLQTVAHNLNHRNLNLRLFEFGKTYATAGQSNYSETEHLAVFLTGKTRIDNWHTPKEFADIYYLKGLVLSVLSQIGINNLTFLPGTNAKLEENLDVYAGQTNLGTLGKVSRAVAEKFDIKTDVYTLDLLWDNCLSEAAGKSLRYREIPKYPAVQRDLAFIVDSALEYSRIENVIRLCKLNKLQDLHLFDVFESEKLGAGKKSMALSFTFRDEEKTLTDKEIDSMMQTIIQSLEQQLQAEIRKNG